MIHTAWSQEEENCLLHTVYDNYYGLHAVNWHNVRDAHNASFPGSQRSLNAIYLKFSRLHRKRGKASKALEWQPPPTNGRILAPKPLPSSSDRETSKNEDEHSGDSWADPDESDEKQWQPPEGCYIRNVWLCHLGAPLIQVEEVCQLPVLGLGIMEGLMHKISAAGVISDVGEKVQDVEFGAGSLKSTGTVTDARTLDS